MTGGCDLESSYFIRREGFILWHVQFCLFLFGFYGTQCQNVSEILLCNEKVATALSALAPSKAK